MFKQLNKIKEYYFLFRKSKTHQYLKKFRTLRKLKIAYRKVKFLYSTPYPFHNDIFFQKVLILIINYIKPTTIIETGTFLGTGTSFMAKNFPKIPIYTCEINNAYYKKSKKNLRKCFNVKIIKETSTKFLQNMIDKKLFEKTPLFFLDAHWENYWPLEDEIKIITDNCKSAVILIDDFKVPDSPQFGFDTYKLADCSLKLIKPKMNKKNEYNLLFPNYDIKDFPNGKIKVGLTGYPIIFMNLSKEFEKLLTNPFVKKYFVDKSGLLKRKK